MAEKEIESLKNVLQSQQKLLLQLYTDLEAEREASATAASEALSMILRLQREKASERLEASQFKRLIEEKMHHAEEVMDIFEDLMHQKEMQIASLELQVQAYRYKMLSMGLSESDIGDFEFEESMFLSQNDVEGSASRNQSLFSTSNDSVIHKDLPLLTLGKPSPGDFDEDLDCEFKGKGKAVHKEEFGGSDLSSYWEQIKELDERVKGLSCGKVIHKKTEFDQVSPSKRLCSNSPPDGGFSSSLGSTLSDPARVLTEHFLDTISCSTSQPKDHSSIPCLETESMPTTSQSMRIHDVFEVPQNIDNIEPSLPQRKKLVLEEENRLGKPDPVVVPRGAIDHCCKDEASCTKTSLHFGDNVNKWTRPREGVCVNCHLALVDLSNGVSPYQTQFQQLNKRLENLEGERRNVDHQQISSHEDENLKLLKEIREQLNTIQSEIRSTHSESRPIAEEPSLVSLMEAMFFYSL